MPLNRNAVQPLTTAAATLTAGSAAVAVADTSLLAGALRVSGARVPAGALVVSIDSPTQFTMSAAALSTGSATLTFAVEPVTLAEAKAQSRITFTQEDGLVADNIQTARELCETEVSRSFLPTAWILTLDCFPGYRLLDYRGSPILERLPGLTTDPIILPRSPVTEVTEVSYLEPGGSRVVLDPSLYVFELGEGTKVYPSYSRTWPASRATPGSVRVKFTAGYATPADVPRCVKHAIKLAGTQLYVTRETSADLPESIKAILGPAYWGYWP